MLVPRAYRYGTADATMHEFDEKNARRRKSSSASPSRPSLRPHPPRRIPSETTTSPVSVPTPEHTQSAKATAIPTPNKMSARAGGRKSSSAHDPNALPPAVAALLAVTQIPRPKSHQYRRRRPTHSRSMSIDELVNEWKNDDSSYSSSPALSVLLEELDGKEEQFSKSAAEDYYLHTRSTSAESVPSLEDDDRSILSSGSLPTPGSLRSRKSISNFRKEKSRSLPTTEECATDHPLVPSGPETDDSDHGLLIGSPGSSRASTPKPKFSFKSNLTTGIQALKNAVSSFSLSSVSSQSSQRSTKSQMSDDVLWSHPFLFPRFSTEVRPAISGTPTQAQRRYLNPLPLTFEEQEAPYQLALHAPYLAEPIEGAPTIPMQTYNRRRKSSKRSAGLPDPQSEAGRALLNAAGVRHREPRENSDFLRVVVLEMNMRREGKIEMGRAKIWLPPRQPCWSSRREGEVVPERWQGMSAY